MNKKLKKLAQHISSHLPKDIEVNIQADQENIILGVASQHLIKLLYFLRDDSGCMFKQLMDISGVDYPGSGKRFCVVYQLLSLIHNRRISVKVAVEERESIPTAAEVYNSAGWFEREVFDMYGIPFSDHPDLRRILTDYGFEGHPLRKDFPLTGYVEVRYDEKKKRVVSEPVKLDQEYRRFDFESPWEGTQYLLNDDEDAA